MKLSKISKDKIFLIVAFILYCLWTIVSAIQHEPNGDEYHVWRMVQDMNFAQLWAAMSYEGHFITWHLLQWPFVKWLGMDYHCIYVVSISLMVIASWLLLFKLDFNIIGKLFILFSAPFCYYFPVVARCYALIPPILVGLAILYQRKEQPFLYCILLGLLANTHAYMEGLVAILWCLFVYNQVIILWKKNPTQAQRNLWASLITIVLVIFAFSQVAGGLIAVEHGMNPPGEGKNTPEMWFRHLNEGYLFKSFYTLHRHIRIIPKIDVLATIILWIAAIIGCYESIKRCRQIKWQLVSILFFGIAWQIFFACNIYGMNWQRIHLPYFVVLFVLWLAYEKTNKRWFNIALIAFWLLNTSSQYIIVKDIYSSTGGDVKTAKQYDALITKDAPCYTPYLVGVHDLMTPKFEYVRFNVSDSLETEKYLDEFTNKTNDCYLLIYYSLKTDAHKWQVDTLVSLDDIEYGYHLYYVKRR